MMSCATNVGFVSLRARLSSGVRTLDSSSNSHVKKHSDAVLVLVLEAGLGVTTIDMDLSRPKPGKRSCTRPCDVSTSSNVVKLDTTWRTGEGDLENRKSRMEFAVLL
jgi:hypothetical protein